MQEQLKQLRLAIDEAIGYAYDSEDFGKVTAPAVSDVVIESNRDLIRDVSDELARRYVRRMVGSLMKETADKSDDSRQLAFFPGLEGLPTALSFEDGEDICYIRRSRARREHYERHLKYLGKCIHADTMRRNVVAAANERLEELRERFGDLPECELLERAERKIA